MHSILRNSGAAYRHFRPGGLIAGAHRMVLDWMQHKLFAGTIVLMGAAGLVGALITFWPI
jgi:uncharacterized membrane protein SpoIIM required for sporulation